MKIRKNPAPGFNTLVPNYVYNVCNIETLPLLGQKRKIESQNPIMKICLCITTDRPTGQLKHILDIHW